MTMNLYDMSTYINYVRFCNVVHKILFENAKAFYDGNNQQCSGIYKKIERIRILVFNKHVNYTIHYIQ